MTTLGDIHDEVRANIRRGTSLDGLIPGFVRKAALWIERNNTLQYMRKFATISVDASADTARYITLEDTRIKSVELFRWNLSDGTYQDLALRSPKDFLGLEVGTPSAYWLDGVERLVLASTPGENLSGELQVNRYTSWPTSLTATHWLIDNAEDILEAMAMVNFAKHARDPDLLSFWKGVFDTGLVGLYAADAELQFTNTDLRMGVGPE